MNNKQRKIGKSNALIAISVLLFLILIPLPLFALPQGVALSDKQTKDVEAGNITVNLERNPDGTSGLLLVIGYVDAPIQSVWSLIRDPNRIRELHPELKDDQVKSLIGNKEIHYYLFDYPWPLEDRWVTTELTYFPENYRITWKRIDGTVKESQGSWLLYPDQNRTLIFYRVRLDPGLRIVPDWFVRWGVKNISPRLIQRIREYFKKNPPAQ